MTVSLQGDLRFKQVSLHANKHLPWHLERCDSFSSRTTLHLRRGSFSAIQDAVAVAIVCTKWRTMVEAGNCEIALSTRVRCMANIISGCNFANQPKETARLFSFVVSIVL